MEERYYDLVFIVRPATPEDEVKKILGVLDHAKNFLDLVFRRRRPDDENQVVITLFHDDLFSSQTVNSQRFFQRGPGNLCRFERTQAGEASLTPTLTLLPLPNL